MRKRTYASREAQDCQALADWEKELLSQRAPEPIEALPSDGDCITLPDGECVATNCMHDPHDSGAFLEPCHFVPF